MTRRPSPPPNAVERRPTMTTKKPNPFSAKTTQPTKAAAPDPYQLSDDQREKILDMAREMGLSPEEKVSFIDEIEYAICLHREWATEKYDQEKARKYLDRFVAACETVELTLDDATYWESIADPNRMAGARALARHHFRLWRECTDDQSETELLIDLIAEWRNAASDAIRSRPLNRHGKDASIKTSLVRALKEVWAKHMRARPFLCEVRSERAPRKFIIACFEMAMPGIKPTTHISIRKRKQ